MAASIAPRSEAFVAALPGDHSGFSVVHHTADAEGAKICAPSITIRGPQIELDRLGWVNRAQIHTFVAVELPTPVTTKS